MPDPFDPELHIRAMSAALRLDIAPEYVEGIATNLRMADTLAGLVVGFRLPDEVEQAPVFEA